MTTVVKFSEVKDVIVRLFPDYKGRRDVYIVKAEQVQLTGTYWDGGSRSAYAAYEPISRAQKALPRFDPPQFGGPVTAPFVPLSDGSGHYIVVAERHCGSHEYITLHVHPDNFIELLPAPTELTPAQKIVLAYTRGLKSSYAGVSDYRFYEAHNRTGISRQVWDAAKAECITKGLLNKAGAITADGKNAVGETSIHSFERDCMKPEGKVSDKNKPDWATEGIPDWAWDDTLATCDVCGELIPDCETCNCVKYPACNKMLHRECLCPIHEIDL